MKLSKTFEDAFKRDDLGNRQLIASRNVNLASGNLVATGIYQLKLSTESILSDVLCFFPLHKDGPLTLDSRKYKLHSFQKAINLALQNSRNDPGMAQLIVFHGDIAYEISNIRNTIYIVWANNINLTVHRHVASKFMENTPILFHFDGNWHTKNVFILKGFVQDASDLQCLRIHAESPVLWLSSKNSPFVCESTRNTHRRNSLKRTHRYTEDQVDRIVKAALPDEVMTEMICADHTDNEYSCDLELMK